MNRASPCSLSPAHANRCSFRSQSFKGPGYVSGSYPILAYSSSGSKSLENGSWTNGHCVTVTGKVNGTCLNKTPNGDLLVKSNGTVLHSDCKQKRKGKKANKVTKPELRGLISAPVELGEAQSVKSVEDESQIVGKLFNTTGMLGTFVPYTWKQAVIDEYLPPPSSLSHLTYWDFI